MEGIKFVDKRDYSSFQVYYHLKAQEPRNNAHYLPILGVLEKNYLGQIVDTINHDYDNQMFWFKNNSHKALKFFFEKEFNVNRETFSYLSDNVVNIQL